MDAEVGQARRLRLALGLKQTELAAVLHCHPTTISRWETGACPLDRHALRIMEALAPLDSNAVARVGAATRVALREQDALAALAALTSLTVQERAKHAAEVRQ